MVLFGGAGHSIEIAKRLSKEGRLIGIDRDEEALASAKNRLKEFSNVIYIHGNHDNIKNELANIGIEKVDGILLDLGVSSYQLDEKSRGFSYMQDSMLDMRMDKTQELTAKEVVNTYSEEELIRILQDYGEEKFAKNIVRNIIKKSIPLSKQKDGHPAKRTFQAIRIEVNNEISPLKDTVKDCVECLNSEGRLCIITFHSLEDRAVKQEYIELEGRCTCPKDLPYCICGYHSEGKIINKKPILPTNEEQEENTRAKSAKLRIFQKA